MATQSLKDLYTDELRDLFDAEHQLLRALPQMIEGASSPSLRRAFQDHLEQTRIQAERLELIFQQLGQPAKGKRCAGMEGLLKEGQEHLRELSGGEVKDAALIGAAQRVEHYEIAAYGTARTFARQLGAWDQADLLQQTLEEEGEADHRLTAIAESGINEAAQRHERPLSADGERWSRLRYADVEDLPRQEFDFTNVSVRNAGGDDLGTLDGFIVEQTNGRPLYYVVDSGGWFVGGRYLVPVGKGRFDGTSRTLTLEVAKDQLQRYPEFNTNAFLSMSDEQARGYERRLLSSVNPEATRTSRYWESYDRLPDYAKPAWLTVPSWEHGGMYSADIDRGVPAPRSTSGAPAGTARDRDRELIRARDDESFDAEREPGERMRGVSDEQSGADRNPRRRS